MRKQDVSQEPCCFLVAKERADYPFLLELLEADRITTSRSLFGALYKADLDALMAPGVFTIITYVPLSNF